MTTDMVDLRPREVVSLIQAGFFLIASISLFSIWTKGTPGQRIEPSSDRLIEPSRDASILFLALAYVIWCIMALLQYGQSGPSNILTFSRVFRTLFSTMNTAFILGATAGLEAYEELVPQLLKKWFKRLPNLSSQGAIWVAMGIFFMFGFATNMIFMLTYEGRYANCPDVVLGVLILVFVVVGLYKSFSNRGFHILALLSIVVVIPYIMVQFTELPWPANFFDQHPRYDDLRWVANISFKTSLCMLFMALIVSWMYEKAGGRPSLKITAPSEKDGKIVHEIYVSFGCTINRSFELTEKGYLRVLEIAQKYRERGGPIKTSELYHKTSVDEIRQDLTKVLEKTRIDPLFGRPGEGLRGFHAAPADIMIDSDIENKPSWENVEFAKVVLGDADVFERGLKVKEARK